jgi:glycine hydroxymethyltransferase
LGSAEQSVHHILALIERHERWRIAACVNLLASENLTSPAVRATLASDFGHRYTARDGFYMGTRYIDEVEAVATELAQRVFRAKFADVRPLSGHLCNLIVAVQYAHGAMISVDPDDGGYPGASHAGLGRLLGLRNLYFPYDSERLNIDTDRAKTLLLGERPSLALFGASFFAFPHPLLSLKEASGAAVRVYDGSHVLGLIAGGQFQDPLREGCDILIGSTHKSFFGPQGGLILTNDRTVSSEVAGAIYPGLVDNAHWNRIAALAVALAEMKQFGRKYAQQVTRNARQLALCLWDAGVPVRGARLGFTESHQVIVDYGIHNRARAKQLEAAGIICDCGIRLGTSEVTRRGMREEEMRRIGQAIAEVWRGRVPPRTVKVEARRLAREFSSPAYTFT